MTGYQFTLATDALSFLEAGNAVVTLVSKKSGRHLTYKVRQSSNGQVKFVSLRTNGEAGHYRYMGLLKDCDVIATSRTEVSTISQEHKAFTYALRNLRANVIPQDLEVWHEGTCGRCGRQLTDPESIARGIGPECIKHIHH